MSLLRAAEDNGCAVCNKEAEKLCGKCNVARYCSREHQVANWKIHKSKCFPCRIEVNETLGRHLVASRDIKAGELIFSDSPIMVAPIGMCEPSCLGCMGRMDGSYKCPKCGWPLCGPDCRGMLNHFRECELIQPSGVAVNITNFRVPNPMYYCVAPLRCLWMKHNAPDSWKLFNEMESHVEDRKKTDFYDKDQIYVVCIIRDYFKLTQFSEEEIQTVCGILQVNGFDVPRSNAISVYSFGYLMEHSCLANTTRTFSSNLDLVVKAAVDIRKGDHIQTCYVDPLKGERIRKAQLLSCKYFTCSCPRCQDPTDFGTHLSSSRCHECPTGLLPPPKVLTENYRCVVCQKECDVITVEKLFVKSFERMNGIGDTIAAKEKFLKETQRTLSEGHQFRVEVKLGLLQAYGKENQGGVKTLSSSDLARKVDLCHEVLQVANVVVPGLSRVRGIILYELQTAYVEQHHRLHKRKKYGEEGEQLLKKIELVLKEALRILKMETHIQEEMQMALEVEQQLKLVEGDLEGLRNHQKKQSDKPNR